MSPIQAGAPPVREEHKIVIEWEPQTGIIRLSERPTLHNRHFWDYFLAEVDRMVRREIAKDEAGRIVRPL